MQVEIETKPKVYEPKTLKITFETEEECRMFVELTTWDVSIPELVYPSEPARQTKLKNIMQKIQKVLLRE